MKVFNLFRYVILLHLFTGCGVRENTNVEIDSLSVVQSSLTAQAVNSSKIFSSVECIPLETTSESLLHMINKIFRKDNFIYISDINALYKFNEEGILIGKIQKQGTGPGEYLSISDFELETEDTVWILSRNNRCLYQYTWAGELLKQINLGYWASKMYLLSPEKMCLYIGHEKENTEHQVKIINLRTNEITGNFLPIGEYEWKYLHVMSGIHYSKKLNGDGIYFFTIFNDTIYHISNDDISPVFRINILGKSVPASFFKNNYQDVLDFYEQYARKYDYPYGTVSFTEYESNYLFAYFMDKKRHFSIISKEKKESVCDFTMITEDVLLSGYPIDLLEQNFLFLRNNELVILLLPSDIMEYAEANLSRKEIEMIKERIKYTREDQNPVLLIVNM
ncbi:MAG: 6-bladed beta-propeller [Tannerella sp.]|jgi:hypothetical protein|nr:6-bladed beta-propeller [Tannerella sp.]